MLFRSNVAAGFISVTAALPHIRSGRLKILVIAGKERLNAAPDVPTAAEVGMPDVEIASGWFGVLAPARTPRPIIEQLNAEVHKVMRSNDMIEAMKAVGVEIAIGTPEEFGRIIESEIQRWGKVVRALNLKPE